MGANIAKLRALMEGLKAAAASGDVSRQIDVTRRMLALTDPTTHAELRATLCAQLGDRLVSSPTIDGVRGEGIALYREAIELAESIGNGTLWADYQYRLGSALLDELGDVPPTAEEAVACFEKALGVVTRDGNPDLWASIHNGLGSALKRQRDPTVHYGEAIEHYRMALTVHTLTDAPAKWALTRNHLGTLYLNHPGGNRQIQLERAIGEFDAALQVYTRESFPRQYGMVHHNLAIAWRERLAGDPSQNLEVAIEHGHAALSVSNRATAPLDWATAQMGLGTNYANRIQGSRLDNIELAITHYRSALEIFTQERFPRLWAGLQGSLGNAYRTRVAGDPASNTEVSIDCLGQALTVLSIENDPGRWADTHLNLGNAYYHRHTGDRAANLELAIDSYELALKVHTSDHYPDKWARLQYALGNGFRERISGSPSKNIERAILHYEQSLEVRTRSRGPFAWAATQNGLANAYSRRLVGSRQDNLARAIEHYRAALEVRTPNAYPRAWAQTLNNLALALTERVRAHGPDHLEEAIACLESALSVYSLEDNPADWAMVHNNLGNAYRIRYRDDYRANLARAIEHYHAALQVRTREAYPGLWAGLQMNLANVFLAMAIESEQEQACLRNATAHNQAALEIYTEVDFPVERANTKLSLGVTYRRASLYSDASRNLSNAIQCFESAVNVFNGREFPADRQRALLELAELYFSQSQWSGALAAYTEASELGARLLNDAQSGDGRLAEIQRMATAHVRASYCLAHLGEPSRAFEVLDQGKARLLTKALRGEASLGQAEHAGQDIRSILSSIPAPGALIAPAITPHGTVVFVIPSGTGQIGSANLVWADGFDERDLNALLLGTSEAADLGGWMGGYLCLLRDGKAGIDGFGRQIRETLDRVWSRLLVNVIERVESLGVPQGARLVFLPQGGLSLLPLHAATRHVDGRERALLDDYEISYAPSAAALVAIAARLNQRSHPKSLLVIADPAGDLPFARAEAEALDRAFQGPVSVLLGSEATRDAVLRSVPNNTHIHFACHASYDWLNVSQSALYLAHGTNLRLSELFPSGPPAPNHNTLRVPERALDLRDCRLISLAACETGVTDPQYANGERASFVEAFIESGAAAVISSLWPLDENVTRAVMEHFYRAIFEGMDPAGALRKAQLWVRDARLFPAGANSDIMSCSNPFYWAALTITGC